MTERTFKAWEYVAPGEPAYRGGDNSAAIQRAVDDAALWLGSIDGNGAGEIELGPGQIRINNCIKRRDVAGIHITGAGEAATTVIAGTALMGRAMFDLTGSYDCGTYKMSIGDPSQGQWVTPSTAIYAAQIPMSRYGTKVPSNALNFEHLAIFGAYSHACLYAYSVASSNISKVRMHNSKDSQWASALTLTDRNIAGLVPDGTNGSGLIAPGSLQLSGWNIRDSEFHDLSKLSADGSSQVFPVRIHGGRNIHFDGGNAQTCGGGYVEFRNAPRLVTLEHMQFYIESRGNNPSGQPYVTNEPWCVTCVTDNTRAEAIAIDDSYIHLGNNGTVFGSVNGGSYGQKRLGMHVMRDGWIGTAA